MPSFLRKGLNYLDEQMKWLLAGKPVVSDDVHAYRRNQCNGCDRRDVEKDTCLVCGCPLHASALGDKLSMATAQCPLPEPKWLAMPLIHEGIFVDEPIPTWRQVCIWIDQNGKPTYVDGLTLRMEDVIIQDVWVKDTQFGDGRAKKWNRVGDLVPSNFTGKLQVVINYDEWRNTQTGSMKVEVEKGEVRFEAGKPVEVG